MAGGTGTATLDFGAHPGSNEAEIVVTGITGITPTTAKKRVAKVQQLQKAIEPIAVAIPEQKQWVKSFIDTLAEYDGTADEYTALMVLVQRQMEEIERVQARKTRNRRIAIAMLLSS